MDVSTFLSSLLQWYALQTVTVYCYKTVYCYCILYTVDLWLYTVHDRICGCHFANGKKENGPTIFAYQSKSEQTLYSEPDQKYVHIDRVSQRKCHSEGFEQWWNVTQEIRRVSFNTWIALILKIACILSLNEFFGVKNHWMPWAISYHNICIAWSYLNHHPV